jgi:hypothetical protein
MNAMTLHDPLLTRRTVLRAMLAAAVSPIIVAGPNRAYAQGSKSMKIRVSFNNSDLTATLEDNPTARDFASLLPLEDLKIENYGNNEKISYLPRKLTEEGSGRFGNERAGDLCYFAPWGNLAMFHAGYRWSQGLIRLGRFEGSIDPLLLPGEFPLRIDLVS